MGPTSERNPGPHHTGISGPHPMESPAHIDRNTHITRKWGYFRIGGNTLGTRKSRKVVEMMQKMVFGSRRRPSRARSRVWDGNGRQKDREWRQMGVYWFAADRPNENSG